MEVGLTKDTGWQVGLRRTFPVPVEEMWDLLISPQGMQIWLGCGEPFELNKGATYQLNDGTTGEVRVVKTLSHFRITRHPPDPDYLRASTIQIRVLKNKEKTTLVFHEEHLPNQNARSSRKVYYLGVVEKIRDLFGID
jgi:hypothetical protein